jgi:RNA polymerase sigma-70 factor (ECF subfamily)
VETARAQYPHDQRAFETLVLRHQRFVVANCRFITRSSNDAEDLAQEVFVKAFFGLPRFEGRAQFKTWLQRIKVNHCLNYVRTKGLATVDIADPGLEGHEALQTPAVAEQNLEAAMGRESVERILDGMSDTLRIPLILRDADGLSYEEIAAHIGIGLSAVKMRIKRGREEFRRRAGASRLTEPAP